MTRTTIDYEFRHRLYDTLVLLGAPTDVAELLKKSQDHLVSDADVEKLRAYNCGLIDSTKHKLANINMMKITPVDKS